MEQENEQYFVNLHIGDITAKSIFENPILCAQFLKDNVKLDIFKDVKPEDIENVTERYITYFGAQFDADSVVKVLLHQDGKEESVYVIPLIDHKSDVDYNVAMQLLKYMVCIWMQYEREFMNGSDQKDIIRNKSFRYPPIIPIVYYEGSRQWNASLHLKDRILMSDILTEIIPDFRYIVISNHDYTGEELIEREDEMSLFMLINRIQTATDMEDFCRLPQERLNEILKETPPQIVDLMVSTIRNLCRKLNATTKETEECVEKVRKRQMGYLFENMEKMDIQAERRNTAKEKERADQEKERADQEKERADQEKKRADQAQKEVEVLRRKLAELEGK